MKKNIALILSLIVMTVFTACNKQKKEHLLGEWDLLSKPVEEVTYRWYFTDSKVYIMATDGDENGGFTGDLDTCAYGAYVLKNGVLTLALPEYPCRGSVYHGDWDIQGLDDSYMTIRRETESGTQWYEFQKVSGDE